MKKIALILSIALSLSFAVTAQTNPAPAQTASMTQTRPPIFRANKEQINQVQKILKVAESGKLDDGTRAAIKTYQTANGLKSTGTLNRATLEKMNIALTDKQKEIPVSANSFATSGTGKTEKSAAPRKAVFRANKEQVTTAQKMLKDKGFYSGEQSGKLDTATRDGIRKFQESVGMKVTGTLNKETLEKMGIALTDKQKEM